MVDQTVNHLVKCVQRALSAIAPLQQLFCLPPEIVKNIDTIDTNLSNLHALLNIHYYSAVGLVSEF